MDSQKTHTWHFFRMAGSVQPDLSTGADIHALEELDQTFWSALSAPAKGVCFDAQTLKLLDADADGRIRAPDVLAAIAWLKPRVADFDLLINPGEAFPLAGLREDSPEAKALRSVVKEGTARFSEAGLEAEARRLAAEPLNGDGVIVPESVADDGARPLLEAVIAAQGGIPDRSGAPGANRAMLEAGFARIDAWQAWKAAGSELAGLLPALAPVEAVRAKVDDFFKRVELAAFAAPLPLPERSAGMEPGAFMEELPLMAGERGELSLTEGINPAWQGRMEAFAEAAQLIFKRKPDELTQPQWLEIKAALAPVSAWLAARPPEPDPLAGLDAAVAADKNREALLKAVEADLALAERHEAHEDWRKLFLLYRNLVGYLKSYVNFSSLYSPDPTPIFRMGTLYMDGRACSLCFHVAGSAAAHAGLAAAGKICLAYCAIQRPATGESGTICAAFTTGRADSLQVGRNGLFYDREGKDWEATLVQLVDHPISLREAFWSPWRKIVTMLGEQIQKLLTSRNEKALKTASTDIAARVPPEGGAPAATAPNGAALASSIAVVGIALGFIGSAVGGLIGLFTSLPVWKTAAGVAAIILIVSLPSVALTWFKLRARDLSPVLNACGWAMNRPLRLTLRLGAVFTAEAKPPLHAVGSRRDDPYADQHSGIHLFIGAALAAAAGAFCYWYFAC